MKPTWTVDEIMAEGACWARWAVDNAFGAHNVLPTPEVMRRAARGGIKDSVWVFKTSIKNWWPGTKEVLAELGRYTVCSCAYCANVRPLLTIDVLLDLWNRYTQLQPEEPSPTAEPG